MSHTIRPGREEDIRLLVESGHLASVNHHAYAPDVWNEAACPERVTCELVGYFQDPEGVFLVAISGDGALAGYAAGRVVDGTYERVSRRSGFLDELSVFPQHRRAGVGSQLTSAVMAELKRLGAEDVMLHVALDNEAGVAFYRTLGFRGVMTRMFKRL